MAPRRSSIIYANSSRAKRYPVTLEDWTMNPLDDDELAPVSLIMRTKPHRGGALYLGGVRAALFVDEHIDLHMACAEGFPPDPWLADDCYHVQLDDDATVDWLSQPLWVSQVSEAARLVADAIKANKVALVTCHMGLNRSGLVAALALCMCGVKPDVAVAILRDQRDDYVLCNSAFCKVVGTLGGEMYRQANG